MRALVRLFSVSFSICGLIFFSFSLFSPQGSANPINGSVCNLCDPGMYAENGALTCLPCQLGSHASGRGSVGCAPCGVGFYSNNLGSSSCETCVSGFFCPGPLTSQPVPCLPDHYCPQGSYEPRPCPVLYGSPAQSEHCSATPAFYGVIVSCVLAVVIVMLVLAVRAVRKRDKLVETTPLMGKPSSSDSISVGAASGKQSGTLVYGGF